MLTSKEKSDTKRLPMMPIRDVVIFPYMMTPFVVGRESSVRALEEATALAETYVRHDGRPAEATIAVFELVGFLCGRAKSRSADDHCRCRVGDLHHWAELAVQGGLTTG